MAMDEMNGDQTTSKNYERKVQRKQKRFQCMISNDSGVVCCDQPSRNLVVCNAGLSNGLDQTILVSELRKFGAITDVFMLRDKSYCFVVCADEASAIHIYEGANGKSRLGQNDTVLYLTYCTEVPAKDSSFSSSQNLPPGLEIIENFITPTEEEELINLIEWNDEQCNAVLKHRQVKHFGYEFQYGINNVDTSKPLVNEPMPQQCNFLWNKLRQLPNNKEFIDSPQQLTVNKYEPGQGIPLHADTHSAFSDAIISLSLASDVVMDFRKPTATNSKEYTSNVSVLLPRRSLLVISGESRYGWKHGITPRKIDIVRNNDGFLITTHRQTRISYTFRWLCNKECNCEFHSLCDSFEKKTSNAKSTQNAIKDPSLCELENVHKVYNEIANHFSETRHSPWPQVNAFIQQFDMGSVLVDIGCGNGKYLNSNRNIFEIGCDRSEGLLNICSGRQFNTFQCDCLEVPVRSHSVDGCISIAVIHHLASEDRRIQAIQEMIRILRPTGRALIYVWAKNQALKTTSSYLRQNKRNNRKNDEEPPESQEKTAQNISSTVDGLSLPVHTNRTQFEHTDILVPWKLKNLKLSESDSVEQPPTFLRFYHVFEENELENLCKRFANITIEKSYYDQGNWCVIFQKN